MANQPTLLVLAAGMGSRYGGLKQLDPMGPNGETILDYSVYDAMRAGFRRIVFVIRKDIEAAFRETVGKRYDEHIDIAYAFQELADLPGGFDVPEGRSKPWGTGHAILAARNMVKGAFAVINADDFYGADAYKVLANYFNSCADQSKPVLSLVSYSLRNTLSQHGTVNRGLCRVENGLLQSVQEIINISQSEEGIISGIGSTGDTIRMNGTEPVSMNFWGFSDQIFQSLGSHFQKFLEEFGDEMKSEFYIPAFVDRIISEESAACDVLSTSSNWFGVTYPADKPYVQQQISNLIAKVDYPTPLQDA